MTGTMRRLLMPIALTGVLAGLSVAARAQQWQMPAESERCPSKWGAGDQKGAANLMTPEMTLKATKLIKTGKIYPLAFELGPGMVLLGTRRFDVIMKRSSDLKPGSRGENEETVYTELGQVGTQLDAFSHQIYGGKYYNCFTNDDLDAGGGTELDAGGRRGFSKLGVEHVPEMFTRGVLIDVAGLKGVDMLPPTYVITAEDLQQALAREKVTLEPGDAVMINTGWGKLYGKDNARYTKSSPGIGIDAGEWLVKQNPMMVGADNCCLEVRPYPGQITLPIHAMLLIVHGVYIVENLKLDELAAAQGWESAFILEPLKMKGGTGSTVSPIAVR